MYNIKSERRWQVRKLIILTNLMLLGIAYYMDYHGIEAVVFVDAMNGFQLASAGWLGVDYWTTPKEDV